MFLQLFFFLILFSLPFGLIYFERLIKKNNLELILGIILIYLALNTLFFLEKDFKQGFRDLVGFSYMLLPYIFSKLDKNQFSKIFNFTCAISLIGILIIISKNFFLMGEYKYNYLDDKHPFNDPIYIFGITYFTFFSYHKMKFFFKRWSVIFISTNIIYLNYVYYTLTASNRLTILVYIFTITIIVIDFIFSFKALKNFNEKFLIFYENNKSLIFYSILILIFLLFFLILDSVNKVFSSRFIEIRDTIEIMKETYFNLLFGSGIGSKYEISFHTRPVGFTHIFIYYLFLKIGFFGFVLFLLYFYELTNINKINFFNFINFFKLKKKI